MIFFETLNDASRFMLSPEFNPYQNFTSILSEKLNSEERIDKIYRSTCLGKINLITKSFVRGTDFIIYSKKVVEIKGVHLITTFILQ